MDEKKKVTDQFTREMGFKSCEHTDTPILNKEELFGTQTPIVNLECKNSYSKTFECTGLIDVNKNKVNKSACEEKTKND